MITIAPVSTLAITTLISGVGLALIKPLSPILCGLLVISGSNLITTAASLGIGRLVDNKIISAHSGLGLTVTLSLLAFIVNVVVFTFFIASPALLIASMVVSLLAAVCSVSAAFHRVEREEEGSAQKNVQQLEERLEESKSRLSKVEVLGEQTLKERETFEELRREGSLLRAEIRRVKGERQ